MSTYAAGGLKGLWTDEYLHLSVLATIIGNEQRMVHYPRGHRRPNGALPARM